MDTTTQRITVEKRRCFDWLGPPQSTAKTSRTVPTGVKAT
jgi:hypothetical protein